jgi:hypothetical protein
MYASVTNRIICTQLSGFSTSGVVISVLDYSYCRSTTFCGNSWKRPEGEIKLPYGEIQICTRGHTETVVYSAPTTKQHTRPNQFLMPVEPLAIPQRHLKGGDSP